jgi:5-methylcytosine-specific restriction endonuclease McrA
MKVLRVRCACGCKEWLDKYDKRGRERKYLHGHYIKKRENRIGLGFPKGNKPWNKGISIHLSPDTEFTKGLVPWNKGKTGYHTSLLGKEFSLTHREKLSLARFGKEPWNKGKECWYRGEKHPNWKGGRYKTERRALMAKIEYRKWRKAVFERDNFTCQICGRRSVNLEAHHIIPYYIDKERAIDVTNGRTLCRECHRLLSNWGKEVYKYGQVI